MIKVILLIILVVVIITSKQRARRMLQPGEEYYLDKEGYVHIIETKGKSL